MVEHSTNYNSQNLNDEVQALRQENQSLRAQLSFHKKIFDEMRDVLGAARQINRQLSSNEALQMLMSENERLKGEMRLQRLSNREREILKFIVRGATSKEIAIELDISKLTVDTHRKNIQQKLGVGNTAELIKIGMLGGVA